MTVNPGFGGQNTADAPASVRPATTARMVAKATAEIKPRNRLPPTALAR
ncbi:hypothetical protein [uncultured Streptococcus sp.]